MNAWRAFWWLVWKDVRIEYRAKQLLFAGIAYGVLLIVVTGMALNGQARLPADWAAGLLWLNLAFTVAVAMARHDAKDRESGAHLGLLLAPVDRSLVYYARWFTTSVFVLFATGVLVAAFFVVFAEPLPSHTLALVLAAAGGTVGLTGLATFLSLVTAHSSLRDVLLPLLLFPLAVPLLLGLIRLTVYALGAAPGVPYVWAEVVGGYIIVLAVLPWLLLETLLEV